MEAEKNPDTKKDLQAIERVSLQAIENITKFTRKEIKKIFNEKKTIKQKLEKLEVQISIMWIILIFLLIFSIGSYLVLNNILDMHIGILKNIVTILGVSN